MRLKLPLRFKRPRPVTLYKLAGGVVGVLVVVNLLLALVYSGRTYPAAQVGGVSLGSVPYSSLPAQLDKLVLLPATVQLTAQGRSTELPLADTGIALDKTKTVAQLRARRHAIPLLNFFRRTPVPVVLASDTAKLAQAIDRAAQTLNQPAASAAIMREAGAFSIKKEVIGEQINLKQAPQTMLDQLAYGRSTIALPTTRQTPPVTEQSLTPQLQTIQKQQQVAVTYKYEGKTKRASPQDIAAWYEPTAAGGFDMADKNIAAYVAAVGRSFGIGVDNTAAVVTASKKALQQNTPAEVALVAAPARRTITYCTALRGVDTSYLQGLQDKLAATYSDPRGWAVTGQIAFRYGGTGTGCELVVWLAAADQMPTFGAICDSTWSCTVKPHVVINLDRWRYASDAWNKASNSLDDYRSMVINHETGHWLGFGHQNCPGSGQLAPVMQQQSIDLQGCKFNPWPLPAEQAAAVR